jgi:hypothetical protein
MGEEMAMRAWLIIAAVAVSCSGCTAAALERRTINQASTLTELQYLQVLDNIAMFACNPDALPWHMKLTSASIQVTDQGTATFLESILEMKPPATYTTTMTLSAQRGIVNQWGGLPAVDPEDLQLLELAYQKAIDPQDPTHRIRAELFAKIAELAVQYNVLLSSDTLNKMLDCNTKLEESKRWLLRHKSQELYEQLERVFDQVAKLSLPISDIQVDNYAQRLTNKVTEETRGEARAKLQLQQAQMSASVQQVRVGVEDQIVSLTREACSLPYIPRYPVTGRPEHNPYAIQLVQNKIKSLLDLAEAPQFAQPWVCAAPSRTALPEGACYVGHFAKCGCHCYVTVPPVNMATLRDFTLIILTLAPIETQESASSSTTGTITYSPTVSGGSGH